MALEHHGYKIYLGKKFLTWVRNFGSDKVSRCEMSHLLADRCSRHIQSVFNLIMDIHVMVN